MKRETDIGAIAVKDKTDVIKAADILEKYQIKVFSSNKIKEGYLNSTKEVKDNFLMKNMNEEGWRVQSHYLGLGIKPEEIEELIISGEATFMGKPFYIPLTREQILEKAGWTIVCQSPLEIEHKDGSSAKGLAAQYCIDGIIAEYNGL